MDKVICNIPHAGLSIPTWSLKDFAVPFEEVSAITERMADRDMDKLFSFVSPSNKVVSPYSRVVVDMERFINDADEPMAKKGMGLFYEKDENGKLIRERGSTYSKCLGLYDAYHRELVDKVYSVLEQNGSCWVLDCHSFDENMSYMGYSAAECPDVCIGFNGIPSLSVLAIKEVFEDNGFSVGFNIPFSGSLVPMQFMGDNRVNSVMVELNRKIYKGDFEFLRVQSLCEKVYGLLNRY